MRSSPPQIILPIALLLVSLSLRASSFAPAFSISRHQSAPSSSPFFSYPPSSTFYLPLCVNSPINVTITPNSSPQKAWKKRRRTHSPLMMPATVQGCVDKNVVKANVHTIWGSDNNTYIEERLTRLGLQALICEPHDEDDPNTDAKKPYFLLHYEDKHHTGLVKVTRVSRRPLPPSAITLTPYETQYLSPPLPLCSTVRDTSPSPLSSAPPTSSPAPSAAP